MAVELADAFRFQFRTRGLPLRCAKGRLGALAAHGPDDVDRPRGRLVKLALDREGALAWLVGEFHHQTRRRIRQDERLADLKVLNRKGPSFK